MIYEDKVNLVYSQLLPAGSDFKCLSIGEEHIPDLLGALSEIGIQIDKRNSEKNISYSSRGMEKSARVPLETVLPDYVTVPNYILRGDGLEIVLENFRDVSGGSKGRMGGSRNYKGGVVGTITYEGDNGEGVIKTIQGAFELFFTERD